MRFGLISIFYTMAVIGSAIAGFSPGGIVLAAAVLTFWAYVYSAKSWKAAISNVAKAIAVGLCLLCCVGLILPTISAARESARANQCSNQLRQIGLALNNYLSAQGCFPPAFIADEAGRPMHSWRVLILPYMEERGRYNRYDFSEPWDGPNNRLLASPTPFEYRCPSHPRSFSDESTSYVALVGPHTMWPGAKPRQLSEVADGAEQTLLVTEVFESGIHWMEPRDLSVEDFQRTYATDGRAVGSYPHCSDAFFSFTNSWQAVFADTHTARFSEFVSPDLLLALLTVDGGEPIDQRQIRREPRRHWRWGRLIAATLFSILAVVPALTLRRHIARQRSTVNDHAG